MPKPIVFEFESAPVTLSMNKVDRARLYGFKELRVLDESGEPCELATLGDDGRKLVGRGGTGIGYLTADGNWCDKEGLRPVNLEGETIVPVKSSFGSAIRLDTEVTFDQFLDHSIRLIYHLQPDDVPVPESLNQRLQQGAIFQFEYSYRGGLEADAGFLIANDKGEIFMLVGDGASIQFVGLGQSAAVTTEPVDGQDADPMDFGMI